MTEIPGPSPEEDATEVDLKKLAEYRRRFMEPIRKASSALDRHPDTLTTADDRGRPVSRKLHIDDFETHGKHYQIDVRVGVSVDEDHKSQPESRLVVEEKGPKSSGSVLRITAFEVTSFGDGTIRVRSAQDVDESGELVDPAGWEFNAHNPAEYPDVGKEGESDHDHPYISTANEALDGLLETLPPA